jgi:lipopolysaccharide export system protein LptA
MAFAKGGAAGSHDSSQPVEITADTLEVHQDKSIAVFTGNVEAIQGKMNLRSQKMTVYYRNADEKKSEKQDSVSKIIAKGDVFLTTPGETAQGNEGVYDVDKDQITLLYDVVVTNGQNVVKGDTLVYNMTTGQSVLNAPSDLKKTGTKTKTRVKGVFIPGGNQKK